MKLTGLIAAPHTPCNADYSLNLEAVDNQAAHLANAEVTGVFVGGTTGECHSFSTLERIELINRWGEVAKSYGLVNIAHVGHNNLPDARALTKAAEESGADAIGAMVPTFFKPNSIDELIEWFSQITLVAPELPFYFYDIPRMTGVTIDTAEFLKQGKARLPSLVGVKFTNPDLTLLERCLQVEPDSFNVLFGIDEQLMTGLELGCPGAVGSSYNFAAKLYHSMMESNEKGDNTTTEKWRERTIRTIDLMKSYDYLPAAKAVMEMLGVACGPARPPLVKLSEAKKNQLQGELEEIGLFEWIK